MNAQRMQQFSRPFAYAVFAVIVAGCGPSNGSTSNTGQTITIKGSDTMLHLVTAWASAYMGQHPDVSISVTGGGSGTGIAALLNNTTDICASSREVKQEEIQFARQKALALMVNPVARDAITVIVNPQNPVSELTIEQLKKIYTGAYATWDQVGGTSAPIIVISRESSSGTYLFFLEHVLNKEDYTQDALLLPATSAVIQSVADSPNAVGYVGLGYAEEAAGKVKLVSIKAGPSASAVLPSTETVLSGEYAIARPLNLVTSGEPDGPVKSFLEYCISPDGQAIVSETGYVKVK